MKIKEIKEIENYPENEHFAILWFQEHRYYSEDYDSDDCYRNIIYEEIAVPSIEYLYFENKEDLLEWIEINEQFYKDEYKIVVVKPVNKEYLTQINKNVYLDDEVD